tara:strand:+ start:116 stop:565 length:450 start_codon:yes stop_codon:yes gene_type:complete
MKFQVIRPFSIVKGGKSKSYAMGQRIGETAYSRLSTRQQTYFLSARAAAGRAPYTREEVTFIIESYIQNDNRMSVRDAFQKQFPNSLHTGDSVMFQACLLENLDNTKDGQNGSYHLTDLVIQVAQEIDPERFSDPSMDAKLDSVLASLR